MQKAIAALAMGACVVSSSVWADYTTIKGEWVYLKRNHIHNHALVKDVNKEPQCNPACLNFTIYDTRQLANEFGFEPGARLIVQHNFGQKSMVEAVGLKLFEEWFGEHETSDPGSLSYPFNNSDYAYDFVSADRAKARYKSWGYEEVELNYWRFKNPPRTDFFCFSGIFGLRYFHVDEDFKLAFTKNKQTSDYKTHTKNNAIGGQIGGNFQLNFTRYISWDTFAKFGLGANHTHQKQFLGDYGNTVVLRDSEKSGWHGFYFINLSVQVAYWFFDWFDLHGGYQFLFLSGMAYAPEQLDMKTTPNAGKRLYHHGKSYIQGLFLGTSFRF